MAGTGASDTPGQQSGIRLAINQLDSALMLYALQRHMYGRPKRAGSYIRLNAARIGSNLRRLGKRTMVLSRVLIRRARLIVRRYKDVYLVDTRAHSGGADQLMT